MKPKTDRQESGEFTARTPESITENSAGNITGLMARSIIMTLKGEMRVRDVKPGDRVITRDNGMAVVRGVRSRRVVTDAIRIKAGSLGHTRPDRDVTLPAGQAILIRDWRARAIYGAEQAMVPARRLIDGEFITLKPDVTMTVYELEFDAPHVLYVDGLEVAGLVIRASGAKAA